MNVADAIRTKRAVREFLVTALPDENVDNILNAGRRAQSSKNEQAWHFVAVRSRRTLKELAACGQWAGHLENAALGVVILTAEPSRKFQTMFDAGQSAAYMQLAAWELGIASCLATFHETERVRATLGFPDEWHARIAISFGLPAHADALLRRPARGGRKAPQEIVHFDRW